ncbi:hypothetical protein L0B53_06530 [Vibrio sp. SS-MA-C1-2]|uniref:hypothetical protein n=1 Tax=Vibrio sp. SS-MA-C1-2 TaxID=2908646 RepID=UPI001F2C5713|nr:hypothetical protein [Vibrio sp. SS-MA-C1-2]UJF19225.1 hypothetical protein L0B53_06530 [Vibrio sp. SS-MA-C1-2]
MRKKQRIFLTLLPEINQIKVIENSDDNINGGFHFVDFKSDLFESISCHLNSYLNKKINDYQILLFLSDHQVISVQRIIPTILTDEQQYKLAQRQGDELIPNDEIVTEFSHYQNQQRILFVIKAKWFKRLLTAFKSAGYKVEAIAVQRDFYHYYLQQTYRQKIVLQQDKRPSDIRTKDKKQQEEGALLFVILKDQMLYLYVGNQNSWSFYHYEPLPDLLSLDFVNIGNAKQKSDWLAKKLQMQSLYFNVDFSLLPIFCLITDIHWQSMTAQLLSTSIPQVTENKITIWYQDKTPLYLSSFVDDGLSYTISQSPQYCNFINWRQRQIIFKLYRQLIQFFMIISLLLLSIFLLGNEWRQEVAYLQHQQQAGDPPQYQQAYQGLVKQQQGLDFLNSQLMIADQHITSIHHLELFWRWLNRGGYKGITIENLVFSRRDERVSEVKLTLQFNQKYPLSDLIETFETSQSINQVKIDKVTQKDQTVRAELYFEIQYSEVQYSEIVSEGG